MYLENRTPVDGIQGTIHNFRHRAIEDRVINFLSVQSTNKRRLLGRLKKYFIIFYLVEIEKLKIDLFFHKDPY